MLLSEISAENFKKFLSSGALLRWDQSYYLSLGPFQEELDDSGLKIFSPYFFMDADLEIVSGCQSFQISETQFINRLNEFLGSHSDSPKLTWSEPTLDQYKIAFQKIQNEMAAGELKKAVPVLFAKANAKFDLMRRAQVLKKLCLSPPNLFVYGYWSGQQGLLGATPEILVNIFSGQLRSMALAGTQIKGTGVCRLLEDPKERHEHQLVIDDIRETLSPFGKVHFKGPEVLELPSLWHLKTEVLVQLSPSVDPIQLVQKLHPTPALGVFPRSFDFQWMRELPEANIRRKYGAPFAMLLPNGDLISLVAIRNIQWSENQILLGAGGGVVHSSQLQKEWQELEGKRNSVKSLMGL